MSTRPSSAVLTVSVALTFFVCALSAQSAPKYKILHAFGKGDDGAGLWGSLLLDQKGNLYGTAISGGSRVAGIAFRLTPKASGTWAEKVLYAFNGNNGGPTGGLIFDPAGNLYGATHHTVFELSPSLDGWVEDTLYDGGGSSGNLVMDGTGNLYGTGAGAYDDGGVFELSLGLGGWAESELYSFTCSHGDGCVAFAGPILDAAANLYGTTEHGGSSKNCGAGCGTVYQLRPQSDGTWKETILHSFGSPGDGAFPGVGALVLDQYGNLYRTTDIGGPARYGTVFKLSPQANGHWKETILHSFSQGANRDHVSAGVVMDQAGILYGTTIAGGTQCDCGVVYKLAPQANGKWTYTVLHRFNGGDGDSPDANLILDDKGNLYGTTPNGGPNGGGVVFEITP
jgi:uncharacterized repeat protein (TIGR03803 family)